MAAKGNQQNAELLAIAMRKKRSMRKSPAKPPEAPPSLGSAPSAMSTG